MTDLHCDNKRCVYNREEHCAARAVYYIRGICQSVRHRIVVPPPMICRQIVHEPVTGWGKRGKLLK